MALSALGVEIGPLIAGAGVVGVAIGFGAQTVVKDVISGCSICSTTPSGSASTSRAGATRARSKASACARSSSGTNAGHFTVPFGELGAIQNMSRDWVIEKLKVGVTYDTDLDKAKMLIKQIGKELAQDPEFAPHILQPLKMQGVEQFGDFAIQISMKMMTRPGEQFVIRRRAYAMIKKAFEDDDINSVPDGSRAGRKVGGGGDAIRHGGQADRNTDLKPACAEAERGGTMKTVQIVPVERKRPYGAMVKKEAEIRKQRVGRVQPRRREAAEQGEMETCSVQGVDQPRKGRLGVGDGEGRIPRTGSCWRHSSAGSTGISAIGIREAVTIRYH